MWVKVGKIVCSWMKVVYVATTNVRKLMLSDIGTIIPLNMSWMVWNGSGVVGHGLSAVC